MSRVFRWFGGLPGRVWRFLNEETPPEEDVSAEYTAPEQDAIDAAMATFVEWQGDRGVVHWPKRPHTWVVRLGGWLLLLAGVVVIVEALFSPQPKEWLVAAGGLLGVIVGVPLLVWSRNAARDYREELTSLAAGLQEWAEGVPRKSRVADAQDESLFVDIILTVFTTLYDEWFEPGIPDGGEISRLGRESDGQGRAGG